MEISDSQYEHLVAMLADNRTAIINLDMKLSQELKELRGDVATGHKILGAQMNALEEDVGQVQGGFRELSDTVKQHSQSLDGITQLTKSIFDMAESTQRHQRQTHGEEEQAHHGAHDESADA